MLAARSWWPSTPREGAVGFPYSATRRCPGKSSCPPPGSCLPVAATATRDCAALLVFLTAAKTTSTAHEKATGFPNDALVAYIQASQHEAGCPAKAG